MIRPFAAAHFRCWHLSDMLPQSPHVCCWGENGSRVSGPSGRPEADTRSGRGYLARSDQGRHLSSLKSASRLAKGLTAAGVGIASTAIIGLYWN